MNAGRTARERARAELTQEITEAARRQLAESGAGALSLRAVARELGMVSSALYRYFPSRDDLLTALITAAYDAMGEAAEHAARGGGTPARRWAATYAAVRDWARGHPHEYALIYGSPVPGYQAPPSTIVPAIRVPLALLAVVREAYAAGSLQVTGGTPELPLTPALTEQVRAVAESVAPELPPAVLNRLLVAWTQLFGMLSFELFGQLVGSVDPSDEFFTHTAAEMARFVGLSPETPF
jgi:AcrR family transcriptional regulator